MRLCRFPQRQHNAGTRWAPDVSWPELPILNCEDPTIMIDCRCSDDQRGALRALVGHRRRNCRPSSFTVAQRSEIQFNGRLSRSIMLRVACANVRCPPGLLVPSRSHRISPFRQIRFDDDALSQGRFGPQRPSRFALSAILTTCALAVTAALRTTEGVCTAPRPIASPVVSAPILALP